MNFSFRNQKVSCKDNLTSFNFWVLEPTLDVAQFWNPLTLKCISVSKTVSNTDISEKVSLHDILMNILHIYFQIL